MKSTAGLPASFQVAPMSYNYREQGGCVVDDRWSGQHSGIGRFSREVVGRLPWPGVFTRGVPWAASDVLNPQRLALSSRVVLYSPGYNAGPCSAIQLLTLHDLMHLGSEGSAAKHLYYNAIVKPVVRRAGMVLTVSSASASALKDCLDDGDLDVRVVGNAVGAAATTRAFRKNGIRRDPNPYSLRLLSVGNLKKHKNFGAAMDVVFRLQGATLTVVSSDAEAYKQAIEAAPASVRTRVRCESAVTDQRLEHLYEHSDVLLMPSTEEGFGLPALEALSWHLPVVYWEGCEGLAESISVYGYPVPASRDGELWAETVVRASLTGVPEKASLEQFLETKSWSAVAARVEAAITELAYRHGLTGQRTGRRV